MELGTMQLKQAAWRAVLVATVTMPAILLLTSCTPSEPVVNPEATPPASVESTTSFGPSELTDIVLAVEKVTDGFEQPLFVTGAGDDSGRLFVVEKTGRIWIVRDGQKSSAAWLDMSDRVSTDSERGLLGLAFPPDFAQSGFFYIDYTDTNGNTVIARKLAIDPASDDPVDPAYEEQLLTQEQPFSNHNGGMVTFGPDGYLYIGLGDGGSGGDPNGNGQNRETLLGSILRIDVDPAAAERTALSPPYAIPDDVQYVPTYPGVDFRPEIFAWGLRNPWRFSFDRDTGDLWIGDVGQNLWEEVDFVSGDAIPGEGYNFGWNVMEATHPYPPESTPADTSTFTAPIIEYGRDAGQSVTGGYVYRGVDFPQLNGVYFYGDYGSGRIWGARPTDGGERTHELLDTDLQVVSFGEDDSGELYVVDFAGALYRITAR